MYNLNQTYYSHGLSFEQHNKQMNMPGRDIDENSPFAGNNSAFGVEPLGVGRVRFTMSAPGAKTVQVCGMPGTTMYEQGMIDLIPDEKGRSWSVEIDDLEPGFQYIQFYVNGVEAMNPKAPFGHGYGRIVNYAELPGGEEDEIFLLKDVPHGRVSFEIYKSTATSLYRSCYVYTPPGYDANPLKRYPVLYIQHGGGEDETCWLWQGKINLIADNLLAKGECEEMIIVTNAGYAFRPEEDYAFLPGDFGKMLNDDCIPFIDATYRTIADGDHRAMAGLSMGSYQTTRTISDYPDMIKSAGLLSGGLEGERFAEKYTHHIHARANPLGETIFDRPEELAKMKLIFIATGDAEGSIINIEKAQDLINEGATNIETYVTKGVHEWRVWRHSAHRMLQLLFKD